MNLYQFTVDRRVSGDKLNVYLTGQNLNDATYSTHGRFSDQPLDVVDYGRRFTIGLHFKY